LWILAVPWLTFGMIIGFVIVTLPADARSFVGPVIDLDDRIPTSFVLTLPLEYYIIYIMRSSCRERSPWT
jgi:hypothetical protein